MKHILQYSYRISPLPFYSLATPPPTESNKRQEATSCNATKQPPNHDDDDFERFNYIANDKALIEPKRALIEPKRKNRNGKTETEEFFDLRVVIML